MKKTRKEIWTPKWYLKICKKDDNPISRKQNKIYIEYSRKLFQKFMATYINKSWRILGIIEEKEISPVHTSTFLKKE